MKKMLSLILVVTMLMMTATTAFADAASPFSIFGDDDRVRVSSTSGKNYSICKIKINYSDDTVEYGTGFLISADKVVTAGHVLHYPTKDGTVRDAVKLTFYFGCSGTNNNYTYKESQTVTCTAENTFYPDGWKNYDSDLDYGAVKLNTKVTKPTEFFTLGTISDPDNKTITITGYENHYMNTKFSNWDLLQTSGKVIRSNTWNLYTQADGMPGQSGAPAVYGGKVVGIYTYSPGAGYFISEPSNEVNTVTRMTSSAVRQLNNF